MNRSIEVDSSLRDPASPARLNPDWTNILFLATSHLIAIFAVIYLAAIHFSWWTLGLGLLWTILSSLSVTGGYHRLFSHRSYRASWPVRALYLLFGAAAVQNSALHWSADHRMHHAETDRDGDPYNIQRGFWWAHIVWVLFKDPEEKARQARVRDLEHDPLVRFQDRYYVLLAVLIAGVLPICLGALWGDALGALLVAGFLRIVLQWHATFAINSFTHCFGRRPFSQKISARDSGWVALITFGEGYHNYHHRFPGDYRNGIRWYQFDPTKWFVWSLARVGLAQGLRRTPAPVIARARTSE